MTVDGLHIEPLIFNQVGNPQSPGGNLGQQQPNNPNHNNMMSLAPQNNWSPRHTSPPEIPALDSRLVGNNHNKNITTLNTMGNPNNASNGDFNALNTLNAQPGTDMRHQLQNQQLQNQYFAQQIDGLLRLQQQHQEHQQQQQQRQQQQSMDGGNSSHGIAPGTGAGMSNGNSPAVNPSGVGVGNMGGVGGNIGGGSGSGGVLTRANASNSSLATNPAAGLPLIGTSIDNPLLSVLVEQPSSGTTGHTTTATVGNNNNNNGGGGNTVQGQTTQQNPLFQQHLAPQLYDSPANVRLMQQQQETPTASPAQLQGSLGPTPNTAAANVLTNLHQYAQISGINGLTNPMATFGGMNSSMLMPMNATNTNFMNNNNNNGGDGGGGGGSPVPRRRRRGRGSSKEGTIPRAPRPRPNGGVITPRSSQYRGVTKHRRSGRFEAHIWVKDLGRQVYLGGYECEEHAAEAYDIAALKSKGSRTKINFALSKYTDLLGCIDRMSMEELVMAVRRQSQGFSRGTSSYRGVTHHPSGRWEARIGIPGSKHVYLGLFMNEKEAAQAYDRALVRLRGGNAATNFSLAEYRLEMGDYHRMQSRLLRNDPLFTEISANTVLYERWIKNGTEGFPEVVESPEMEAAMDEISDILAAGNAAAAAAAAAAAVGIPAPVAAPIAAGRPGNRSVTRATMNNNNFNNNNTAQGAALNEVSEMLAGRSAAENGVDVQVQGQDVAGREISPPEHAEQQEQGEGQQQQVHPAGRGPAIMALQKQLVGQAQPGEQGKQHQQQQQQVQDREDGDAMQQD